MEISEELKKRFCEDCCIPINIFSEPIFTSRIELYDRYYNTIERYNIFLKMIAERYTSYVMESSASVTLLKPGNCTIQAISVSDPSKTSKCQVSVTDETNYDEVQSIALNLSEMYVGIGHRRTLTATIIPVGIYDEAVIWETSDPKVAEVDLGRVWGQSIGECIITAYSNRNKSKYAQCTVKVIQWKPITKITMVLHNTKISIGQREQLNTMISPADATTSTIYWSSNKPEIATVNSKGVITGKSKGRCIITAAKSTSEKETIFDTCEVLVNDLIRVSDILLNKTSINMVVGGSYTLIASIYPFNATDKNVTWSSTNEKIAIVNSKTGVITAKGVGTCTIRVVCDDEAPLHSAECLLNVVAPSNVRYIKVSPSVYPVIDESIDDISADPEEESLVALPGQSFEITSNVCIGYDADPEVKWKSSSNIVATVKANAAQPVLKSTEIHEDHYYSDYNNIKCKLIEYIHGSDKYTNFCKVDISHPKEGWNTQTCMRSDIYSKDLDGHTMISISLNDPLFTSLFYYSPFIFSDAPRKGDPDPNSKITYYTTWADFVSTIGETDNHHIIYSENLLNEVMCCCNAPRIELHGLSLLNNFYINKIKSIIQSPTYENLPKLSCFNKNRFVIDVTPLIDVKNLDVKNLDVTPSTTVITGMINRVTRLYNQIAQQVSGYFCACTDPSTSKCNCDCAPERPLPMTVRLFTLYKLKSEHTDEDGNVILRDNVDGYIENIYYEGNQPLRFIDTDPCQLPILMRSMSYQELQENDRKFMHRGLMAQFTDDYKIHVPPISSVPDLPKILAENESGDDFDD